MYLSRVEINMKKREAIRAVTSPQLMHAAVMSCFPKADGGRIIWRIDELNNSTYLLLQSAAVPDCTNITERFGHEGKLWETKNYDAFLSRLQNGQAWKFKLTANPTISVCTEPGKRGKVLAHVTIGFQKEWLISKANRNGFELLKNSNRDLMLDVMQSEEKKFIRKNKTVTLGVAVFEGTLIITEKTLFIEALTKGIGRAKAYGCGLMTLARI